MSKRIRPIPDLAETEMAAISYAFRPLFEFRGNRISRANWGSSRRGHHYSTFHACVFWEGEAPAEPRRLARQEPRPPNRRYARLQYALNSLAPRNTQRA